MLIVKTRHNNQWIVLSGATPTVIVPDSPTDVYGDSPISGSLRVFWTKSAYAGHGTISNYIVTAKKVSDNTTTSQTVGDVATYTFTGLTVGTDYTVTVVARNQAGDSVPSAPSAVITVLNIVVPAAPTSVYGDSPQSGTIQAFWTKSPNVGNGVVSNYIVIATKVSDSTTTTVTVGDVNSATLSGLTIGSNYTVTVAARNQAGDSAASIASASITVLNLTLPPQLKVSPDNPRYFSDLNNNIVYLGGSHTWSNLVDNSNGNPPSIIFDYTAWLTFAQARGHNFFRLWRWENTRWSNQSTDPDYWWDPHVYQRTGPGTALDGQAKFDLTKFNQAYFDRMRARIIQAGALGMYPAVMLFNGWCVGYKGDYNYHQPWDGHPMNTNNNINGLTVTTDASGNGFESQTLNNSAVTAYQYAFVEKVIDTIGDLPNITYEIANEAEPSSVPWQYAMVAKIHTYEQARFGYKHPVMMSIPNGEGTTSITQLRNSGAEFISFGGGSNMYDQDANSGFNTGTNPVSGILPRIADTDHSCGSCNGWPGTGGGATGRPEWPWASFTRGFSLLIMDVYDGLATGSGARDFGNTIDFNTGTVQEKAIKQIKDDVRYNVGKVREYAARMDLKAAIPQGSKSSTNFALVKSGTASDQYLVYAKDVSSFTVDLSASTGSFTAEWFDPIRPRNDPDATVIEDDPVAAGGVATSFTLPSGFTSLAILFLYQ